VRARSPGVAVEGPARGRAAETKVAFEARLAKLEFESLLVRGSAHCWTSRLHGAVQNLGLVDQPLKLNIAQVFQHIWPKNRLKLLLSPFC
jgi:hypothetical protein